MVGDGFQQEYRKIIRAGRKKRVPDGTVQMLLSKFVVVANKDFQNVGRGAGPSTISNYGEKEKESGAERELGD